MTPFRSTPSLARRALFLSSVVAFATIASFTSPVAASAQAIPSPAEAQRMIRSNPQLLERVREQLTSSGMSEQQIRDRLRAAGYPESLLDEYFGRGTGAGAPPGQVLAAMRDLGISDQADLEELRRLAGLDTTRLARIDTLSIRDSTISAASAEIFGLALFRGSTSVFMPNVNGPVDASYRVGPGDRLTLIITGDVEQTHELDVTRSGTILIPNVGQVSVANLTLGEIEDVLYTRLGRVYSSIRRGANATARFTINVSELRSNQVFVTGDVRRPGSYRVTSAGTALTALYAAGGPTDRGSLRRVEVRRGGAVVATLDVYDYLVRGDASDDARLQQGDIVFVPVHGAHVRVDGAVARPMTYESKPGEGLAEVIAAAGGLRAEADGRRLVVERVLPLGERAAGRARAVIDVPLGPDGAVPAFEAHDGDLVRVPRIGERVRDRIRVAGHVWTPGPQGFTAGLTLTEALRRAGGLQPDAYLGTVHVSRLRPDSTRVQLRATLVDTSGATTAPFTLQEDDEITVYSRTAFRPERYVAIGGAVRKGGRFPWRDGMTLRDLVLLAGGLTEAAYLREAEIARLPEGRDGGATATTLRVPLDSTFRFDLAVAQAGPPVAGVPLEPFDNVLIMRDPAWRPPRTVWLTGEVRFPGPYTLVKPGERLSDVIERAGGFTDLADQRGAYFSRLTDSTLYQRLAAERTRRFIGDTAGRGDTLRLPFDSLGTGHRRDGATLSPLDSLRRRLRGEVDTVPTPRYRMRVGVDLAAAMRGRADDILLEDGDSLHVPIRSQTVEVRGAVNLPATTVHAAGQRLRHYVLAAGGPSERARTRHVYVVQPSGKIETRRYLLWFIRMDPEPQPGAIVVVPERAPSVVQNNTAQNIGLVAQLLGTLATIIYLTR